MNDEKILLRRRSGWLGHKTNDLNNNIESISPKLSTTHKTTTMRQFSTKSDKTVTSTFE